MNETIDFIAQNWGAIVAAASAVGILVVAIVKKTETKKDDRILEEVQNARRYLRNYRDE